MYIVCVYKYIHAHRTRGYESGSKTNNLSGMYVCMCVYMYAYVYTYVYVCMCVYMCACIVGIHINTIFATAAKEDIIMDAKPIMFQVCMNVCLYIHTYIHTYILCVCIYTCA